MEHRPHGYIAVSNRLSLQPLDDRRITLNKTFLLKLINGSIDCPELLSKVNFKFSCVQVRSTYPFNMPLSTINYLYIDHGIKMMRLANEDPFLNI